MSGDSVSKGCSVYPGYSLCIMLRWNPALCSEMKVDNTTKIGYA